MSCTNTCESNEIKYKGDGAQVLFTFPFTYIDEADVKVSLWDEPSRRWVHTTAWSFANATTIQFNTAPPAPDSQDITQFNIKIGRCTAIDPLAATFYPGSAIRAQDLNDNFEQLQLAIQEGRCQVPSWLFDYLDDYYWNKQEDTTFIDDVWEDEADDLHVPTTGAVDKHIDESIQDNHDVRSVTQPEQITDGGFGEIDDTHYFTTAASAQRHDTYHQDPTPSTIPYEQPGKMWFDTATLDDYLWDSNAGAWVDMQSAGPVGPEGAYGPPGHVIVSDKPPTEYPALEGNSARPLVSGDQWFDSTIAQMYIYYVDNNSAQWVGTSVSGPQGPQGPQGEPGDSITYMGTWSNANTPPVDPGSGDFYVWDGGNATLNNALWGSDDGLAVVDGDRLIYDGDDWDRIPGGGGGIISVEAGSGCVRTGTVNEAIIGVKFGDAPNGTPTEVMPYNISDLAELP